VFGFEKLLYELSVTGSGSLVVEATPLKTQYTKKSASYPSIIIMQIQ